MHAAAAMTHEPGAEAAEAGAMTWSRRAVAPQRPVIIAN